jgi:hypothetical protein
MFYAIKLPDQYLRFIFFLSLTQWALEEQVAQAVYNNYGTGWENRGPISNRCGNSFFPTASRSAILSIQLPPPSPPSLGIREESSSSLPRSAEAKNDCN